MDQKEKKQDSCILAVGNNGNNKKVLKKMEIGELNIRSYKCERQSIIHIYYFLDILFIKCWLENIFKKYEEFLRQSIRFSILIVNMFYEFNFNKILKNFAQIKRLFYILP